MSDAQFALHGAAVHVVIDRCAVAPRGLRSCRGSYRLGARTFQDQPVVGADAAVVGSVQRATVDRRHPAVGMSGNPRLATAEAAFFALSAAVTAALVGLRARPARATSPPVPAESVLEGGSDDDPLAWVRRRRFGAGG